MRMLEKRSALIVNDMTIHLLGPLMIPNDTQGQET